jgi:SAM-dependent methyltransferase
VEGYGPSSYGDRFADVYDDWYRGLSDVDVAVAALLDLAGRGPVLELGVGTGRLAIPLAGAGAARNITVSGIDSSAAMLGVMRAKPGAELVDVHLGDMVDAMPEGPFALIFVAYNTLFNLADAARQAACFAAAAERLAPGGRFVVEAFVPDDPPREGSAVSVRSMTADRVVLSVSIHRPAEQLAEGQFIELTEAGTVRLRPWSIRYAPPDELDAMAAAAGLQLENRWLGFGDRDFRDGDERHVSAWRARWE